MFYVDRVLYSSNDTLARATDHACADHLDFIKLT